MKKLFLITIPVFCLLLIISCGKSKDPTPDSQTNAAGNSGSTGSGSTSGGGTGTGGSTSSSTITYINASFTSINITVNSVTKTIAAGGNVQYTGTPNTVATGSATTSSGTMVGNTYTWTLNNTFPASGNLNNTLSVGGDMFFLKIKNTSSKSINKVYVNYGLVNQTLDNVVIANDSQVYGLGYYKAFSNSNVRGENSATAWSWNTLSLPFTPNQSITVTAN